MQRIGYTKVREVKDPSIGTRGSAGIDFYVPEFNEEFLHSMLNKNLQLISTNFNMDEKCIKLNPHQRVLIPSGIHVRLPLNHALIAFNKSGVSTKKGLDVLACVTGDTLIKTNKGLFPCYILTKEYINKNNIKILSYNEDDNKFEYKNFTGFVFTNHIQCIKLKFDNGSELECSLDHKLLTKNRGWVEAQFIKETDDLIEFND